MMSLLVFPAILAAGAVVQETADKAISDPLIDGIAACLEIPDDGRRLACMDASARKLVEASRRRDIVVVDREQVKKARRSLFGFLLPRDPFFADRQDEPAEERIDRLEAKIVRSTEMGYGKYIIELVGGARWQTTEQWTGSPQPSAGRIATIRRAALGSYFLKVGSGRAVRAMRIG